MSLTSDLAELIRRKPISQDDLDAAALFALDALACAVAARKSVQGRMLVDWYKGTGHDAGRRAFLFGSLVHVLEIDDLHRESVTHPGCVVIPAAWAIAAESRKHGGEFLSAVLQGYEAVCRIGAAVGTTHYRTWHNTSTCGPFGAAFAAAALAGLGETATVWALGNAGTQSSGLWQFLEEGAMSKHLHAGRAAESGLVAAALAARGFTGPARILEGTKGLFAAACPDAEQSRILVNADGPWELRRTSIKPWPSCRHTHPTIEAALELGERINPEVIEALRIETYQSALDLCDNASPASEYEAKFSLHHCAAAALTDGDVTLMSFDAPARRRLAALMAKTTACTAPRFETVYPDRWGARLTATTSSGETLVVERRICKGDPESPVRPDEMRSKARMLLTHGGLPAERVETLIDAVLSLPSGTPLPSIDELYA